MTVLTSPKPLNGKLLSLDHDLTAELGHPHFKAVPGKMTPKRQPTEAQHTPKRSVRQIVESLKSPRTVDEIMFVSAHRGHTDVGVVENTFPAILRAAQAGAQSVEIDIRLTVDGVVVCMHDHGVGRVTNIAEMNGRADVYDPRTGKGYNPLVSSLPYKGCLENLRLKDHQGTLTTYPVMTLDAMLSGIRDAGLQLVVLLDVKSKNVMGPMYEVIQEYSDIHGVSALEWCIFKPDVSFCPTPQSLLEETWYQTSLARGDRLSWIPVFDIASVLPTGLAVLDAVKAWGAEETTLALEIGLRKPGGPLQDVVDWANNGGIPLRLGFYGSLGDQWLLTDPRCPKSLSPLTIYEDHPPTTFDDILAEAGIEGRDNRDDLELFKRLGFSWIIADRTPQTEVLMPQ